MTRQRHPRGTVPRYHAGVARLSQRAALPLLLAGCYVQPADVPVRVVGRTAEECALAEDLTEEAIDYFADLRVGLYFEGCTVTEESPDVAELELVLDTVYITNTPYDIAGVPVVYMVDAVLAPNGAEYGGYTARTEPCVTSMVLAYPEPHVMAHELGHFLGLEHDDREGNLMVSDNEVWPDAWLDDEQLDRAVETVEYLETCR